MSLEDFQSDKSHPCFVHQVTISADLVKSTSFVDIYDEEIAKIIERIKRDLIKHGYCPSLTESIDRYLGGSEDCQCSGCAELINPIIENPNSDGSYTITIEFNVADALREI